MFLFHNLQCRPEHTVSWVGLLSNNSVGGFLFVVVVFLTTLLIQRYYLSPSTFPFHKEYFMGLLLVNDFIDYRNKSMSGDTWIERARVTINTRQ